MKPPLPHRDDSLTRQAYGRDAWPVHQPALRSGGALPQAAGVLQPRSIEELQAALAWAQESGVSLVPAGARSGVCGSILPQPSDWMLDLKGLRDIEIRAGEGVVRCGAGVMGSHLEETLQAQGWTAGHFPSSIACSTVGGWLAARGGGQLSSRYGKIEDICVGAKVLTPQGELVEARRGERALQEWIGSEGTLVLILEATLRIHRRPPEWTFGAFHCPDLGSALGLARSLVSREPVPAVLRVYDAVDTRIALRHSGSGKGSSTARISRWALRFPRASRWLTDHLLGSCLMVVGWQGSRPAELAALREAEEDAESQGARSLGEEPGRRWLKKRHDVSFQQMKVVSSGMFADTFEVSCPWSRVEQVHHDVLHAMAPDAVGMAHFSHAYPEGSAIYFSFAGHDAGYAACWDRIMRAAHEAGATLTHHHGVGRLKAPWLAAELGGLHPQLLACKQRWDPQGLLNPGNLGLKALETPSSPHTFPDGLHPEDGCWSGSAETELGALEQELRQSGWSLGVSETSALTLIQWLRGSYSSAASGRWGSARERLISLSGQDQEGRPFGSRVAPRTAAGPWLLAGVLEDGLEVSRVVLRLAPWPQRWGLLRLSGEAAWREAQQLLQGAARPWAAEGEGEQAQLWFAGDSEAARLAWPEGAVERSEGPELSVLRGAWRPWAEHRSSRRGWGLEAAGLWQEEENET